MRFVDTSCWIALQYRRDRHFEAARLPWQDRQQQRLTTNLVLGETWTFLYRREGHCAALRFIDAVERSSEIVVARSGEQAEREAWAWLRHHDERVYSIVDATSVVVMRSHGLTEAVAFDGDVSAAGFVEVRP